MSTFQNYVKAGYPGEALESLTWLESCSERLCELLESYRYLQPDGKLFSTESIAKIYQLHELERSIAEHMREYDYHKQMIEQCNHEIYCIENGIEIMKDHGGCREFSAVF